MQCLRRCTVLLALATTASASDVTPVQKVIQLMNDMIKKGKAEKEGEATQYATFNKFCEQTLLDKKRSIAEAQEKEEVLAADIEKAGTDALRLGDEIKVHGADIEKNVQEQENATKVRDAERTDFQTTLKDYTESIDALGRAMKSLQDQNYNRAQATPAFVQLKSMKMIPEETKRSLNALLMESAAQQPKAREGYEFQSGGVIQMLEELQNKFLDERASLEKAETAKKQAYDLLMQGLKAQEANDKKQKGEKSESKGKKLQDKANGEGDLAETTAARESDEKYRADLDATCQKKATDFAARQKLRQEEIDAIQKATDIISSGAVAGSADKHLPSLLQVKASASAALASLRSSQKGSAKNDVIEFLQSEAKHLNSKVLSALAVKLSAPDVSIIQDVKRMIENLITKLNKQADAEASKKAYCDKELGANEQTRTEKSETVASLQADIDELTASNAKLSQDISTCGSDITKLNTAMAEATEIRQKEKAKNTQTISDAQVAQSAVAQAVGVLKEFYDDASYATAFVQKTEQQPEAPAVFGEEAYTGMTSAKGGVLGMLEVVESDFARLEAETTAAEAAAKKEYEEFMEDSKVDKMSKDKEVEHKTAKKADQDQELSSLNGDLSGTQKELDAALAYFEKLKPDCVDAGVAYEERKAQREQEIKDLEAALVKLGGSLEEEE
eukprot:TRINITY_DN81_c0_g1_i9.p1 TRINITY_DN81_c0_g1~~TRINITY_DN81_c0_g1_i9.p1  ORF type:complete len:675 (+),score=270.47 TRINITY_DN81_c0_g1_i9:92-2116(+)